MRLKTSGSSMSIVSIYLRGLIGRDFYAMRSGSHRLVSHPLMGSRCVLDACAVSQ
jgi:hypothetical protein